ncbi:MAG: glutamyl-tRNA reductase [Gammaproteobacteria bacterium]|nr:MAG: glutamyl-tRNA reductase [Gammaproteobacteria bacterium]
MTLLALGINHKTAPVAIREKVAFSPDRIEDALREVLVETPLEEVAILSTCNRTEVYAGGPDGSEQALLDWISRYHAVPRDQLNSCCYIHRDRDAAFHMMRVASGLDSLVLGEPQILGQIKDAYAFAQSARTLDSVLERLFQHTFSVAKRVRTETAIGANPVSVAYAAVSMAGHIFADFSELTALLIGAGETIELVARHLKRAGVNALIIANRTLVRAQNLATEFDGEAISLSDIPEHLHRADIVIASTASQLPILGKGAMEQAIRKRRHRPVFIADIAVPRDVEAAVGELPDVFLYTVDDLQQVIQENIRSREEAAQEALRLIEAGAEDFFYQLRARASADVLKVFRHEAMRIQQAELDKALRRVEQGADPKAVLQALANGLTNKLLHAPTVAVRQAAAEGRPEVADWLRELYGLPGEAAPEQESDESIHSDKTGTA